MVGHGAPTLRRMGLAAIRYARKPIASLPIQYHATPDSIERPKGQTMTNPSAAIPWRKKIRLPEAAYQEAGRAWHVVINTHPRLRDPIATPGLGTAITDLLGSRTTETEARLDLYCLMPDHAHLLIQPSPAGLVDDIRDLKSRSTRLWWRHGGSGPLWQRSFYDHGIRSPRDYEVTVRYILENPIRAGLVTDWTAFPLLGGAILTDPS